MRLRQWYRFLFFVGSFTLGLSAQQAGSFSLALLQGHPERWPEKIRLTRELTLEGGRKVRRGKTLRVVSYDNRITAVEVESGKTLWLAPEDCDFVDAANYEWQELTAAQKSLDKETLAEPSLWPRVVYSSRTLKTSDGTTIQFGEECAFLDYTPEEGARIYSSSENVVMKVGIRDTDFLFRARNLALVPKEKRPSRIAKMLGGILEDANGTSVSSSRINDGKLFVLYFGASWSEACQKFAPQLVRFYEQVSVDHPGLAVILLSKDKTENAMLEYMRAMQMPWPAVAPNKVDSSPHILAYAKGAVPQIVVVDRFGEILVDSQSSTKPTDSKTLLWDLGMMLDAGKGR